MGPLQLAARNVLRNRRRSLTTTLAIAVGLGAVLLFGGYVRSIRLQMQADTVQRLGHLQVQHRDYLRLGSADPAAYGLRNAAALADRLRADPELGPLVAVATPVLQFNAIVGRFDAGVSRPVAVTGWIAEDHDRLLRWDGDGVAAGARRSPLRDTPPDAAVAGVGVARVLQLCALLPAGERCVQPAAAAATEASGAPALPADIAALADSAPGAAKAGAQVELVASDLRGAPNVAALQVVQAQRQGARELDNAYLAMHLAQARRLLFGGGGGASGAATALVLQLHRSADLPRAQARLEQLLSVPFEGQPLAARSFAELNPFFGQFTALLGAVMGFVAVLLGSVVLFTAASTMSLAVAERTREVGTLRAIGQRRSGVRRLFVCEGLMLGIAGAAGAALLAAALAFAVNHAGLSWTPPGRADAMPLAVGLSPLACLAGALAAVVLAVLSALWPATRAARLRVVDALRHA